MPPRGTRRAAVAAHRALLHELREATVRGPVLVHDLEHAEPPRWPTRRWPRAHGAAAARHDAVDAVGGGVARAAAHQFGGRDLEEEEVVARHRRGPRLAGERAHRSVDALYGGPSPTRRWIVHRAVPRAVDVPARSARRWPMATSGACSSAARGPSCRSRGRGGSGPAPSGLFARRRSCRTSWSAWSIRRRHARRARAAPPPRRATPARLRPPPPAREQRARRRCRVARAVDRRGAEPVVAEMGERPRHARRSARVNGVIPVRQATLGSTAWSDRSYASESPRGSS